MLDWILAKSLCKEGNGVWSKALQRAISIVMSMVDAKVLVTDDTNDHVAEFQTFCKKNSITMAEMDLLGLLLVAFHVKHHAMGNRNTPLTVLVSSAPAYKALFSECGYYETDDVRFLGYIPHPQVWATKTLKNLLLYPPDELKKYSERLVCFFRAIELAIDVDFTMPRTSEIALRYAGIVDMSDEEIEALRENLALTWKKRTEAADLVRIWKSQGLIETAEEARELLLLFCPPEYASLWYGCVLGGEKTAEIRAEAADVVDIWRSEGHIETDEEARELLLILYPPEYESLWYGSVKGAAATNDMKKVAYEVWRNLVSAGISEEEACLCVAAELSENHANLICHFNGLEAAKAAKEAGMNATLKHKAGGNLSIHERLHMAKNNLSSLRKQIDATKTMVKAIPSSYNDNAGALYECNDCGFCTPCVRYDGKLEFKIQQSKSCINPSCTRERRHDSRYPNAKGRAKDYKLPPRLEASNDRWSFKGGMTGSKIMEYLEKRKEACKEKIARLEAQKDEITWPMATATVLVDDNHKRKRPPGYSFAPRKTLMSCRREDSKRFRIQTVWEI
jgi:uncharacterized protein YoaH (UPF0181 family)